jgi:hypothetical protein
MLIDKFCLLKEVTAWERVVFPEVWPTGETKAGEAKSTRVNKIDNCGLVYCLPFL